MNLVLTLVQSARWVDHNTTYFAFVYYLRGRLVKSSNSFLIAVRGGACNEFNGDGKTDKGLFKFLEERSSFLIVVRGGTGNEVVRMNGEGVVKLILVLSLSTLMILG